MHMFPGLDPYSFGDLVHHLIIIIIIIIIIILFLFYFYFLLSFVINRLAIRQFAA